METATQTFRSGHASDADWETLTASCLTQIGNIPAGANLGFVYVSDTLDEDLPLIADRLREDTGVDHWVGTVGFGVMVGGREYFDTPAMVVLVGALVEDAGWPPAQWRGAASGKGARRCQSRPLCRSDHAGARS